MPTPRKPGAKRGRPPKPKAPPKPRGRKAVEIHRDIDRHDIALTEALLMTGYAPSELAACQVVATHRIGTEVGAEQAETRDGLIRTSWEKRTARGIPATFEGYAATLRGKRSKYSDSTSMQWLYPMAQAFVIALTGRGADAKLAARALASSVGERGYAERVLMKMIDARESEATNATVRWPELTG